MVVDRHIDHFDVDPSLTEPRSEIHQPPWTWIHRHHQDVTLFHELGTRLLQDVSVLSVLDREMLESTPIDGKPTHAGYCEAGTVQSSRRRGEGARSVLKSHGDVFHAFSPFALSKLTAGRYFRWFAVRRRRFRRIFTIAIKSFTGGPSSNQMEDANTKT